MPEASSEQLDSSRPGPMLDVLMPHYRDVDGLALSLASIEQQSWTGDLRVIIVDDGSPGPIYQQVEQLVAEQTIPVKLVRLSENVGRPAARNVLLRAVDAPYMAWLDAGDVWYSDKLRLQFDHLRQLELEGVDIDRVWVTCHYHWSEGGRQRRMLQNTSDDQLSDLLLGERLRAYLWTLLGRTVAFRAAGSFDEALTRLQDMDYFIRFLNAGGTLTAPRTRAPLCRYNKSDIGRNHADIAACSDLIVRKHRSSYAKYGAGFVARADWKYARLASRFAVSNGSYIAATRYLVEAAVTNPRYAAYRVRKKLIGR